MKKLLSLFLLCLTLNAHAIVDVGSVKNPAQKQHVGRVTQFEGRLKGHQIQEHTFWVKQGQRLTIRLLSKNRFAYFNLYAPKNRDAIFTGILSGEQFKGIARKSGEYRIRTYLAKPAAIRKETAKYRLEIRQY